MNRPVSKMFRDLRQIRTNFRVIPSNSPLA